MNPAVLADDKDLMVKTLRQRLEVPRVVTLH